MTEIFHTGGFLYNPETQEVLLHKRDGNTKNNPYKWAFFGGSNEGDEEPIQTFIREMNEELSVQFAPEEVIPLRDYLNEERNTWRYIFYVISDKKKSEMTLGEGADFDWIPLNKVFEYDLTEHSATDLRIFLQTI